MTMLAGTLLSRALALSLLVALAIILWLAVAKPVIYSFTDIDQTTAELLDRYDRYRVTAGRLDAVEEQRQAQRKTIANGGFYFQEQSLDIAAAKLQNLATEIIRTNQGQVQVAQRQAPQAEQKPSSVAISVSFSASNMGLTRILNQIHSARPAILINSLAIRSNLQPSAQQKADATAKGPFEDDLILNIDMQVQAFVSLGVRQ